MNLFENLQMLKENNFDKDLIIDMVRDGFETGHLPFKNFQDFSNDDDIKELETNGIQIYDIWNFYQELVSMGPAGFYEEYRDEVEFSDDFIREYGDEEDLEESKTEN